MSVDLQVVFPQQVIHLNSVREVVGVSPRTIDVLGEDFRSVDEVRINDVASPEIVVLSKKRLLARVPDSQLNVAVVSVSILSNQLSVTEKSLLRLRLGRHPSKVSGTLRLLQAFLKILLTTPGRDIFAPRIGAGALKNLGTTFSHDEGGGIVSDFIVSVGTAQRQMIAIQGRDQSIPLDERLLAAKILSAGYNRAEAALSVSIEVTSQAGRAARANLVV